MAKTPSRRSSRSVGRSRSILASPDSCKRTKSQQKRRASICPDQAKRPRAQLLAHLEKAQACLHLSAIPESLPCRENEYMEILTFAESNIRQKASGCMYLSGVPGTGKTATVKEVVRALQSEVLNGELEDFQFIEINGMRLTEPSQAYVKIWKHLSGQKATAAHAKDLLEKRFSQKNKKATLILVDELDMLWNRKQSILYNLFDWPTKFDSRLVILAIANTMDLPEKVMLNRVTSRFGLTRLQFAPYTHEQLEEIVEARLSGLNVFDGVAIQLVARKVASLSGDARRALDLCRRAIEIAQRDTQSLKQETLIGMKHVTSAHQEMFCSPGIMAIRNCSQYKKMFLKSIITTFRSSGKEETTFKDVHTEFTNALADVKMRPVNSTFIYNMTMELAALRLIIAESARHGPNMKIGLNVSVENVLFALQDCNI